jgi:hypothetical protein
MYTSNPIVPELKNSEIRKLVMVGTFRDGYTPGNVKLLSSSLIIETTIGIPNMKGYFNKMAYRKLGIMDTILKSHD